MKELIAIQSELKAPKNQHNKFGDFNYRSCEDILEGLKPLLKEHNCYITMTDDIQLIGDRYYISASVTIHSATDKVTVKAYAREALDLPKMSVSQVTGSASSYARKYALNGLFAIDDTKDDDTRDNTKAKSTPKAKPTTNRAYPAVDDDNIDLDIAIDDVNRCTTVQSLSSEYKKWGAFQNNEKFIAAIKTKREQLNAVKK